MPLRRQQSWWLKEIGKNSGKNGISLSPSTVTQQQQQQQWNSLILPRGNLIFVVVYRLKSLLSICHFHFHNSSFSFPPSLLPYAYSYTAVSPEQLHSGTAIVQEQEEKQYRKGAETINLNSLRLRKCSHSFFPLLLPHSSNSLPVPICQFRQFKIYITLLRHYFNSSLQLYNLYRRCRQQQQQSTDLKRWADSLTRHRQRESDDHRRISVRMFTRALSFLRSEAATVAVVFGLKKLLSFRQAGQV